MPYYQKTITSGGLCEVEIYFARRTCGDRIPRSKNKNSTDAEQEARNWLNSYKHFKRLLHANFGKDDWFISFDFAEVVTFDDALRLFKNYIQRVRRWRRRHKLPELKCMAVVADEMDGEAVRIHVHAAMSGMSADAIFLLWTNGGAQVEHLDIEKDYTRLTAYMNENQKKREGHRRWFQTRGLTKPNIDRKEITRAKAERLLKVPNGHKVIEQKLDVGENGRYQYLSYYRIGGLTAKQVYRKMRRLRRLQT